jgi:hypothetical protein
MLTRYIYIGNTIPMAYNAKRCDNSIMIPYAQLTPFIT